jgi:hypothetical protein
MKNKNWIKTFAISLIITGSSACATTPEIITVPVELSRPARPVLPRIRAAEAEKIDLMTWIKITERNRLMRQYTEQLETIIDSTRQAKQ